MKQPLEQENIKISMNQEQIIDGTDETTKSSSIIEFLNNEQKCLNLVENDSELDIDSIFEEINRLSDESDGRSVDEILREAELLLSKQQQIESNLNYGENESGKEKESNENDNFIDKWHLSDQLETISEKSTPQNTKSHSSDSRDETVLQTNADLELNHEVSTHSKCLLFLIRIFINMLMFI